MQLNISIHGEDLNSRLAAKQLHLLAEMIKGGTVHADGFNIEYGGEFELDVDFGSQFPHGDYTDGKGNLVHVANDEVVHVTWAGKADQESVSVPVEEWVEAHGALQMAGHEHGEEPHSH